MDYKLTTKPPLFYSEMGGLGNKLFQFCTAYCTAIKTNRTPIVYKESKLLHMFPGISARKLNKIDRKRFKLKGVGEENANLFNTELISNVLRGNNTCIRGYFQSWKYFSDCEEQLHSELVFNSSIKRNVDGYMNNVANASITKLHIPKKDLTIIGIHVRRGDRQKISAPASYIHNAINYFNNRVKYPLYLVVSDDIQWCKDNINTSANIHFSTNTHLNYEDDFIMVV